MPVSAKSRPITESRTAIIEIVGDLDAQGGKRARKSIAAALEAGRVDVTVNLDQVGFVDSAGLASLISSLRSAREMGGDIRVTTTNERIRRVLEVTALARVFKLQPPGVIAA